MQKPTTLSTKIEPNTVQSRSRYNIDNIETSLSPIQHNAPRLFQPGMLLDRQTFQRVEAQVNPVRLNVPILKEDNDNDDDNEEDDNATENMGVFNDIIIQQLRQEEIRQLSQTLIKEQPKNDPMAEVLLQEINSIMNNDTQSKVDFAINDNKQPMVPTPITAAAAIIPTFDDENDDDDDDNQNEGSPFIIQSSSYPPINRTGRISDHDRPYAEYGHLDRQTLAQELQFNLQPTTDNTTGTSQPDRFNAKSFAITAWTDVSKETIMDEIKRQFGIAKIQYICIGEEISEIDHRKHLHIQIILKGKLNRRKPFLDDITQTHCNYQVTYNDLAWNEYIKKGGDYIEFNTFKSTTVRGQKQWPPSASASASATGNPQVLKTTTTTTVRVQAEQRRQIDTEISKQALEIARTNVNEAMDLIQETMPTKFILHSSWYLTTFKYIHLRAQQEADARGDIDKEYIWPFSFPQCTAQLREAMNRWVRHHFFRPKRAKCLILIGSTGIGKTSFALSLPGRVNYFKGRWNLDSWNDYARYSVYDDIPWDSFEKENYPDKKNLFTQNGKTNATDKYRNTKQINVQQPAIVLLNPEDAGSLLRTPITEKEQQNADYWQKRAFIYIMGSDEYFYKRRPQTRSTTSSNASDSSMSSNEEYRGGADEFERMYQHYYEKRTK